MTAVLSRRTTWHVAAEKMNRQRCRCSVRHSCWQSIATSTVYTCVRAKPPTLQPKMWGEKKFSTKKQSCLVLQCRAHIGKLSCAVHFPCAATRWLEPWCAQVTGCARTSLTKRFGLVKGLHLVKIAKKTANFTRVYTVYTAYDFMPSFFIV